MKGKKMAARDINSIMAGWVDRGPWQYYDTLRAPSSAALAAQYSHVCNPDRRRRSLLREHPKNAGRHQHGPGEPVPSSAVFGHHAGRLLFQLPNAEIGYRPHHG